MEREKVKQRLSKRYFGKEAKEYDEDRLKDARDNDIFEREVEIVKKFLKKSKPGPILDIACGTGRVFPYYRGREIYGLDISKDMLKQARKRAPRAKLRTGDAEKLPYKSGTFSVVITSRFIMHTPEYRRVIKEMTRVVKPGGSIIIDFPNRHSLSYIPTKIKLLFNIGRLKYYNLFSYSDIKNIARENKLEIEEVEAKAFLPPRILPESMHSITKKMNSALSKIFPVLSTPLYIRFVKPK